jgi:Tfp pilus assembly ATPase PilU
MASYSLNTYSVPDLLKLLRQERGDRIRLEVGSPPSLTIKGKDFEIEGPAIEVESVEELLRAVAETRQMRAFRKFATVDIIHTHAGARFLIRAVNAFGTCNVEFHAIKT